MLYLFCYRSTQSYFWLHLFFFFHSVSFLYFFLQEKGVFVYNADVSKEDLKHEKIQSNMELVLLCISVAAVVIALILLTVLRLAVYQQT